MGLGPFGPHFDSIREGDRLVAVENEDLDVVGHEQVIVGWFNPSTTSN